MTSIFSSRGRERLAAGIALAVGVAIVVIVVTGSGSSGPAKRGDGGGAATGSATVERRDLVETDTESGTLSYADPRTVYNRLSGTITWLPSVGRVIKPGEALFRVDGQPVTLMPGSTPAYRDLGPSDAAGNDIEQLNHDLVGLGFTGYGIVIDDQWQAATTSAVEAFQRSAGAAETGTLTLGQIVFMPGDQLISTVDATLGSTGGGGSSANASDDAVSPSAEFVDVTASTTPTTPTAPTTPTTPTTATSTPMPPPEHGGHPGAQSGHQTVAALLALLKAETAQLAREEHAAGGRGQAGPSGSQGGGGNAPSGQRDASGGGASASPVLETSSTRLVVTVDLDATKQSEAVVGEPVGVQMPDGSTVPGRITAVSPVAQTSSGSDSSGSGGSPGGAGGAGSGAPSATIPVTIALKGRRRPHGLDEAAVSVDFEQQKANHVLSVPVTALIATAGGRYDVEEVAPPHTLIPVRPGLFAAGYVQISGPGIHTGLEVTDSQG